MTASTPPTGCERDEPTSVGRHVAGTHRAPQKSLGRRSIVLTSVSAVLLIWSCLMAIGPGEASAQARYKSARDSFSRSAVQGWGTAVTGGAYSYARGTSGLSVSHGKARVALAAGTRRQATLKQISVANVSARVLVRVQNRSTKSEARVALLVRVRGVRLYRLAVRVTPYGRVYAAIDRVGRRHAVVRVAKRRVVARKVHPGTRLVLGLKVRGSAEVSLKGKVSLPARSKVVRLSGTDKSAHRIRSGAVGVWAAPLGHSKRPVGTVIWDHLIATPLRKPGRAAGNSVASADASEPTAGRSAGAIHGKPYLWTSSVAWSPYRSEKDPIAKRDDYNIASTPTAIWIFGTDGGVSTVARAVADAAPKGEVPQFVLYAIPNRDCGGLSSGGSPSDGAYRAWIDKVVAAIGSHPAVVILEPDAISFCNDDASVRAERTALLTYAAKRLHEATPNVDTYLHAGSAQLAWSYVVPALADSGIKYMRGFALNVSSHGATSTEESYGDQLVAKLASLGIAGKHYVVDTSRNGAGPQPNPDAPYNSCNNENAALGTRPTTDTSGRYDDAYLWIKSPGLSDGTCHRGDPVAGSWFPELASNLVANARAHDTIIYRPLP